MLCEGAYLYLLLKYTWGVKPWQMWCLITAGWTLPAISITPYTCYRIMELINEETERYANKLILCLPSEAANHVLLI